MVQFDWFFTRLMLKTNTLNEFCEKGFPFLLLDNCSSLLKSWCHSHNIKERNGDYLIPLFLACQVAKGTAIN